MAIPRIMHRIWLGADPLPDAFVAFGESWRRHHPGWEHRLWTEDNLPDVRWQEILDPHRVPAERANMLRYELLLAHGGVYVDTDFECLRPLDELIDGLDFFAMCLKPGRVANGLIGARPGHPIVRECVEQLRPVHDFLRTGVARHDKGSTGSVFFDRIVARHRDSVRIFPSEVFFPVTNAEREAAYALHHKTRSWGRPPSDVDLLEARLAMTEKELRRLEGMFDRLSARVRERSTELKALAARVDRSEGQPTRHGSDGHAARAERMTAK
jgi:mannosyltransferase OCH1-like enzyme